MQTLLETLTRELPTDLERREAAVRTFDAAARTVEAVIATASPVQRNGFLEILDMSPAAIDLEALRGISVLNSHRQGDTGDVIGVIESARREGDTIIATIRFSSRADLAPFIEDVRTGIIRNLSIGYQVSQWRDGVDASGTKTRTAVKWRIAEASFVSVPADPRARTRQHNDDLPSEIAQRNRAIRELASRAGAAASVADALIDRQATLEQARSEMFETMLTRGRQSPFRASVGESYDGPDATAMAMTDALYARMSGTPPSERARPLMHFDAIGLMREHCAANGIRLRSQDQSEVYRVAMERRDIGVGGMHTTDFPTLLLDASNRRLGNLWTAMASGATAIAGSGTVRDFRDVTEARISSFPSLEPVNELGEIKWGTLDAEGEVYRVASFARAIGVSFQVMVNDDLGAIDRAIRDTAFAAATLKAKLIVAALAATLKDGDPLFHADHNNLAVAGSVLSEASLSAGRIALSKQSPPGSSEPLGLVPTILMVPSELQTIAEKLVATINPTQSDDVNVFSNKLQVAVEPRLASATGWYLFAAPGTYPVIRFVTLQGFEQPRFEVSQEFNRLGTSFRVHWHVGAAPIDYRGAWKNAGA